MGRDSLLGEKMVTLSSSSRKSGISLVSGTLSAGVQYSFRSFTKPHLGFRLGLLWVVLENGRIIHDGAVSDGLSLYSEIK